MRVLASIPLVFLFLGCGGAAGKAIRPQEASAQTALNEESNIKTCTPAPGQPLVVDMRSSDRSDFELAMNEGVAVVSYNCKELHLLRACSLKGGYAFKGVSRKEDMVQLESKDEVAANMPVSGAKLSAGMKSGSTLDLALVTVGKKRASAQDVSKADLEGDCKEATHIVRGAYVGAFAMGTGTLGHAQAVAELFGAGVSGSSRSDRQASTKDGDITSCRQATKDAAAPPEDCQAILRLDLAPIREAPPPGAPGAAAGDTDEASLSASSAAPPSLGAHASASSGARGKKPRPSSASSSSSPGPRAGASAAPPPPPAEDETPQCPPGMVWTGVKCKAK
jgi:uncharacterized protein